MLGLLRAEVRRLTSRRLTRILGGLALLVVLLVEGRVFTESNRDLDAARRRAEQQASGYTDEASFRELCESMKAGDAVPIEVDCASPEARQYVMGQNMFGSPEDYYRDPRLLGRQALPDGARAVAVGVAILAFLVGASFVGADWHHGTMQALLFWEPRRPRVLLAKALALVAVAVAFAAALQAVVYALTFLTAATRGSTEGVTAGLQMSVLLTALRGMIVVAVTALLGYAVSGLARITAASLGVAFVYFVIVENVLRGYRPGWRRYLFSENVTAVLLKRIEITPPEAVMYGDMGMGYTPQYLGGVRGVVTLAVYMALLLGAFFVTFTRRDVT